ncbi:competence type IV pilus major pilin ComGC [Traorella massiliensis]|uniref:competence type IV pilus major pilin ComGC n=1 Tax=Traorella massiliensis TaxID=1903263 RepID=UPI0023535E3F|nr:competence type IV pilus major pilin ComGC [Traorella massiliensis]
MKKGFTVLEMILVLSVISLIFLITLPNIQQKNKIIQTKGCEALTSVVDSQILLYEVENLVTPDSINDLIEGGYLKEGQNRCPNGSMIEIVNGQASIQE